MTGSRGDNIVLSPFSFHKALITIAITVTMMVVCCPHLIVHTLASGLCHTSGKLHSYCPCLSRVTTVSLFFCKEAITVLKAKQINLTISVFHFRICFLESLPIANIISVRFQPENHSRISMKKFHIQN